jgi:exonuclease SbcC
VEETTAAAAVERVRAEASRRHELERAVESARRQMREAEAAEVEARSLAPEAERRAETRRKALAGERPEEARARARARDATALEALDARQRKAEEVLGQADQVDAAAADVLVLEDEEAALVEAQAAAGRARDAAAGAEAKLLQVRHRLESARRALEVERATLRDQTGPVDAAPCATSPEWSAPATVAQDLAGACPLLAGARGALDRLRVLGLDPRLERDLEGEEATHARAQAALAAAQAEARPEMLADVRRRLTGARRLAAIAPSIERARAELAGLEAERRRLEVVLGEDLAAADQAEARTTAELEAVERELAAERLAAAERERQATARLEEARRAASEAARALQAAGEGDVDEEGARAAAREASAARQDLERELRVADQELAGLAVRLEEAERSAAAADEHEASAREAEGEVADWQLLERGLGRDGIQALEIDAAGPEVARITNELLEACYGPRFSIGFETLREKRSARGEFVEAFDVKVYDGGRDRPVEALSGGERVVVGEAIGLAIAIFNARRSGVRWETLFRDETAGALDPKNASAYADMLRRALSLGGFYQVVFVAHQAEVVERADVVLEVTGGRVSVQGARVPARVA